MFVKRLFPHIFEVLRPWELYTKLYFLASLYFLSLFRVPNLDLLPALSFDLTCFIWDFQWKKMYCRPFFWLNSVFQSDIYLSHHTSLSFRTNILIYHPNNFLKVWLGCFLNSLIHHFTLCKTSGTYPLGFVCFLVIILSASTNRLVVG